MIDPTIQSERTLAHTPEETPPTQSPHITHCPKTTTTNTIQPHPVHHTASNNHLQTINHDQRTQQNTKTGKNHANEKNNDSHRFQQTNLNEHRDWRSTTTTQTEANPTIILPEYKRRKQTKLGRLVPSDPINPQLQYRYIRLCRDEHIMARKYQKIRPSHHKTTQ
jgi:hypothetical protein